MIFKAHEQLILHCNSRLWVYKHDKSLCMLNCTYIFNTTTFATLQQQQQQLKLFYFYDFLQ